MVGCGLMFGASGGGLAGSTGSLGGWISGGVTCGGASIGGGAGWGCCGVTGSGIWTPFTLYNAATAALAPARHPKASTG